MDRDICSNYHRGNAESVIANKTASKTKLNKRDRIMQIFQNAHFIRQFGTTCEDIEIITGWKHQTVSARISELKRDGKIMVIGKCKTESGCQAAVYGPVFPRQSQMFE